MKYVFTVNVPANRYIDITADFKIRIAMEVMNVTPVRSKVGHVIAYTANITIEDFKKACQFENKVKMLGYQYGIRKVD
ncbi:hypothetical protein Aeh1ORF093c [Aeromonas phage Aeh1]|uniref:Uncharacterized protein n=1 Tax=Aeromonas phage Aeh1 TaxID=2880362 RepID=Q76YZ2_9CAUD|nr:hypothetical protein Aeh1p099 [Aeromonas phage Aeh1]AAQ17754.1 hypothetical protein Aeh1ORF093c [Aeromonas phage Aeh1]